MCRREQNKRQLLAHEDYADISNRRTKLLAILRSVFVTFLRCFKYIYVFFFSTISCASPNDVLWSAGFLHNPVGETL